MRHIPYPSAPIAPIATQTRRGSRRTLLPSTPPRAATGTRDPRAIAAQRAGPRPAAPGWLAEANAGDRNANPAPARAARRNSTTPCAELVTSPPRGIPARRRPPRRCTPAPKAAANRQSPATTSISRRARQIARNRHPNSSRPGAASCRNTTPHSPRGSRATAAQGSGRRTASVNNHNGGTPPLTLRPHATSLWSMHSSGTGRR